MSSGRTRWLEFTGQSQGDGQTTENPRDLQSVLFENSAELVSACVEGNYSGLRKEQATEASAGTILSTHRGPGIVAVHNRPTRKPPNSIQSGEYSERSCFGTGEYSVCVSLCLCVCMRTHMRTRTHLVMSNSLRPMDCSPPCSSVHGILQARIVVWVAISSSWGSSQSRG